MADDVKVEKGKAPVAPEASQAPADAKPSAGYGYGSGYGKKPMWFWILIYVVVGAVVYYGIYALYIKKNSTGSGLYDTSSSGSLYGN